MAQLCPEETSCCSSQALPSSVLNLWPSSCHPLSCVCHVLCVLPSHFSLLLVGPASHLVPSPPTTVWDVVVSSRGASTQRHGTGYMEVLVARGQEHLGCPATGTCSHLWPVWELPWPSFPLGVSQHPASSCAEGCRAQLIPIPGSHPHLSPQQPSVLGGWGRKKQQIFLSSRAKTWRRAGAHAWEMLS